MAQSDVQRIHPTNTLFMPRDPIIKNTCQKSIYYSDVFNKDHTVEGMIK